MQILIFSGCSSKWLNSHIKYAKPDIIFSELSKIGSTVSVCWVDSNHEALIQCWLKAGSPSATLAQH